MYQEIRGNKKPRTQNLKTFPGKKTKKFWENWKNERSKDRNCFHKTKIGSEGDELTSIPKKLRERQWETENVLFFLE